MNALGKKKIQAGVLNNLFTHDGDIEDLITYMLITKNVAQIESTGHIRHIINHKSSINSLWSSFDNKGKKSGTDF